MKALRLLLSLTLLPLHLFAFQAHVSADSALLMNADTGAILFEKNGDRLQYPASVIKVATALYVFEQAGDDLDRMVVADKESLTKINPRAKEEANYQLPPYWLETDAKLVDILPGESYSLRDLLYGALVASGADSCNLLAKAIGDGSITRFVEEMNDYLRSIGCENTTLMNPHGLHNPNQRTTARDLATLTRRSLQFPEFREMVSASKYTIPATAKQKARKISQTNHLLKKGSAHYSNAIGVKTGWTGASKNTFIGAAEKEGRTLIAVMLKTESRKTMFAETKRLFEKAFAERVVEKRPFKAGAQNLRTDLDGGSTALQAALKEDVVVRYYPSEKPDLNAQVVWKELTPPIAKGEEVGELLLTATNQEFRQTVPLYAAEAVSLSLWRQVRMPLLVVLVLGVGFVFVTGRRA